MGTLDLQAEKRVQGVAQSAGSCNYRETGHFEAVISCQAFASSCCERLDGAAFLFVRCLC